MKIYIVTGVIKNHSSEILSAHSTKTKANKAKLEYVKKGQNISVFDTYQVEETELQ